MLNYSVKGHHLYSGTWNLSTKAIFFSVCLRSPCMKSGDLTWKLCLQKSSAIHEVCFNLELTSLLKFTVLLYLDWFNRNLNRVSNIYSSDFRAFHHSFPCNWRQCQYDLLEVALLSQNWVTYLLKMQSYVSKTSDQILSKLLKQLSCYSLHGVFGSNVVL